MATINTQTGRIQLTWKEIGTVVGSVLGSVVVVALFLWFFIDRDISHVSRNVDDVKLAVKSLQENDTRDAGSIGSVSGEMKGLNTAIGGLTGEMRSLGGQMTTLTSQMSTLTGQMNAFQARLAHWDDPKAVDQFVESLKKAGLEKDQKIFVVPFR